jgi:ferredoxin
MPASPPRFTITLMPSGRSFAAPQDASILEAAAAAGLALPSSCRNGTCRACLCRLTEGAVRYRIDWPGLSAEEKAEGWILPCSATPASDLVIDQPDVLNAAELRRSRRRPGRGF